MIPWRSVKDEMPQTKGIGAWVLVYAIMSPSSVDGGSYTVSVDYLNANGNFDMHDVVTHWCPLYDIEEPELTERDLRD